MTKVYLLHGSGAGHQSDFLKKFKHQFEQALAMEIIPITLEYMASIEATGKKRPPPRLPKLVTEVQSLIDPNEPVILIGKSMGSRIIAELCAGLNVRACIALGFPFYPTKKPEKHRLEHFERTADTPYLILQGTRDSLGEPAWVSRQSLPNNIRIKWFDGADHDFHCLKRYTMTQSDVVKKLVAECAAFLHNIDTH